MVNKSPRAAEANSGIEPVTSVTTAKRAPYRRSDRHRLRQRNMSCVIGCLASDFAVIAMWLRDLSARSPRAKRMDRDCASHPSGGSRLDDVCRVIFTVAVCHRLAESNFAFRRANDKRMLVPSLVTRMPTCPTSMEVKHA